MDLKLTNKHALITGGSGGLGKAIASQLLQEGCRVSLTDLDEKALNSAAEELNGNDHIFSHAADLTLDRHVEDLERAVKYAFGPPQILVSAAGITGAKGDPLSLEDDDYLETWETNFLAAVRVCRAFVPAMADTGWGRVILVSSENAVQPYWEEAVYNTAKAALLNFAKGLSREYAARGVLVNSVAPAFIETPMTDKMMDARAEDRGVSREEAIKSFLDEERPYLELKRRGRPEEVAAAVAFLASGPASFINGASLRVDGGAVATVAQ